MVTSSMGEATESITCENFIGILDLLDLQLTFQKLIWLPSCEMDVLAARFVFKQHLSVGLEMATLGGMHQMASSPHPLACCKFFVDKICFQSLGPLNSKGHGWWSLSVASAFFSDDNCMFLGIIYSNFNTTSLRHCHMTSYGCCRA